MINALTTKLEVDILHINELDQAIQLAAIHKLPAIIIPPQLVVPAISTKVRRRGQFKIITTIDWPKGEIYGINKLRGMTREMMETDGYEILMTGDKTEIENKNEVKIITDFIRHNISPTIEIRYVLNCFIKQESETIQMASVMKDIQTPAFVRTDNHLRTQITKTSIKAYTQLISEIRKVCSTPLKLSGNIDNIRIINNCLQLPQPPSRFAVSLPQLQQIIKDLEQQTNELREPLTIKTTQ